MFLNEVIDMFTVSVLTKIVKPVACRVAVLPFNQLISKHVFV